MLDQLFSRLPLIVFLATMLIYWIGAFIVLYHLIRFGVGNRTKILALVFFAGSMVLVLVMFTTYLTIA